MVHSESDKKIHWRTFLWRMSSVFASIFLPLVQDSLFLLSSLRNFPEDRKERYRAANPKPGTEGWPRVSVAGP